MQSKLQNSLQDGLFIPVNLRNVLLLLTFNKLNQSPFFFFSHSKTGHCIILNLIHNYYIHLNKNAFNVFLLYKGHPASSLLKLPVNIWIYSISLPETQQNGYNKWVIIVMEQSCTEWKLSRENFCWNWGLV